ncbi:MAG: YHYH protein [Akkermansiaceae bacterium]
MKKIIRASVLYALPLSLILLGSSCDRGSSSSSSTTITDSDDDDDDNDGTETVTTLHSAFSAFTGNVQASLSGDVVVITSDGLPDHTSPYWSNTTERSISDPGSGNTNVTEAAASNHPLFVEPTATTYEQMAPGNIDDFNGSYSLTVSASPSVTGSPSATGLGAIGIATSGAMIYNDEEGPNVPLDSAIGSLDYNGAHTGPQSYHYHLEPKAWSDNDTNLIGIMADGFFLYGRLDYDGSSPSDLDESGGHFGPTIHNPDGEYHYHIQNVTYLGFYILFPGDYQGTPSTIQ